MKVTNLILFCGFLSKLSIALSLDEAKKNIFNDLSERQQRGYPGGRHSGQNYYGGGGRFPGQNQNQFGGGQNPYGNPYGQNQFGGNPYGQNQFGGRYPGQNNQFGGGQNPYGYGNQFGGYYTTTTVGFPFNLFTTTPFRRYPYNYFPTTAAPFPFNLLGKKK